jgi:uncharacterized cupin superfamily protein
VRFGSIVDRSYLLSRPAVEPRTPLASSKTARRWRERGFSCGLWVDPPGQVPEDYAHETDHLVMVVDGDVDFEIHGNGSGSRAGRR